MLNCLQMFMEIREKGFFIILSTFGCGSNLLNPKIEEQTSNQKLPANQKPKSHESETKNHANQKLKHRKQIQNPANQKLRIRTQNWIRHQDPRIRNQTSPRIRNPKKGFKPNLPTPLNILLNEILPPTYPHNKGSNPPPPLNTMLKRMLHLFVFSLWGIKSATPSGHYFEWYITVNLSS